MSTIFLRVLTVILGTIQLAREGSFLRASKLERNKQMDINALISTITVIEGITTIVFKTVEQVLEGAGKELISLFEKLK